MFLTNIIADHDQTVLQIPITSSGGALMNTRLVIIFVVGNLSDIGETALPQNVDAILIIEGDRIMLWQQGMDLTKVNYGCELYICYPRNML